MKAAVLVFPGSNCDRDMAVALRAAGLDVTMVWHKDSALPDGVDIVAIPGGFSFGDYLRCGAIAARSPISRELARHVERGGYALGVCNGFQVLTEAGLLPGALVQNASTRFICKITTLRVETSASAFTARYNAGTEVDLPIAHHEGNYRVDDDGLKALQDEDRVAFRYLSTPNGALDDIAGVLSANRRVLGMMPHPERAADAATGLTDGAPLFAAIAEGLVTA
ncbi:MAG: phosphoribosylformylglycinamidine synthase subunit PurQ [Pseudomonadota bacterium]